MIVKLIGLDDFEFELRYPDVTYGYFKSLIEYNDDKDVIYILNKIYDDLDVTVEYNGTRLINTKQMVYTDNLSLYYYYLIHLDNQLLYNLYLDKLINKHKFNVEYEINNPIIQQPVKQRQKQTRNYTKAKYVKQVTFDMFTGKETYLYSNAKTGDIIQSDNPDLLDELNGVKKKREKKVKSAGIPMSSMTFSFTKK